MKHFNINEDEERQIKEWEEKHDKECPIILEYIKRHGDHEYASYYGTIAGGRTYSFTPTSIGNFITVKCCCGASFDVDSNW